MSSAACLVCGEVVAVYDQADHLRFKHPGTYKFWFDGKPYLTFQPSMQVAELLRITDGSPIYHFYEERDGGDVSLSHAEAVDLTREPRFYCVPPATMYGGHR